MRALDPTFTDPLTRIFCPGAVFDHRRQTALAAARGLAGRGFVSVEDIAYVTCRGGASRGWRCGAHVELDPDRGELEHTCPRCGRAVVPTAWSRVPAVRVTPDYDRILAKLRNEVARLGPLIPGPRGDLRVLSGGTELVVRLADLRRDALRDRPAGPVVYVLGNALDLEHRIPRGAPRHRLIDILLREGLGPFRRSLHDAISADTSVRACPHAQPLAAAVPDPEQAPPPEPEPTTPSAPSEPAASLRIPAPPCTPWRRVELYSVDGHVLAIRVPGRPLARYTFEQFGLAHARTGRPHRRWEVLAELCERNGHVHARDLGITFPALREHASRLRTQLRATFAIDDDPFVVCSKRDGLVAAFMARDHIPRDRPLTAAKEAESSSAPAP